MWQHLRICSKPYRKHYGNTWTRGKVPDRVGIENRPAIVDQKARIGDWEANQNLVLVGYVGAAAVMSVCAVVLVPRWGLLGASWAYLVAMSAATALFLTFLALAGRQRVSG